MSRVLQLTAAAFAAVLLLGGAGAANATTYTFTQINGSGSSDGSDSEAALYSSLEVSKSGKSGSSESSNSGSGSSGDSKSGKDLTVDKYLSVDVTAMGKDAISFTFYNTGEKSSITDIYVAGTMGLVNTPGKITGQSSGVNFSIGADPANLPGGKPYDFVATAGADSNAPVVKNGVDSAKEYVTWTFALASGVSYDEVVKAIDSGQLRIGLRAPGSSGGSSSFINSCGINSCSGSPTINTASVPLPASIWLMFAAMGGLTLLSRRRRQGTA